MAAEPDVMGAPEPDEEAADLLSEADSAEAEPEASDGDEPGDTADPADDTEAGEDEGDSGAEPEAEAVAAE